MKRQTIIALPIALILSGCATSPYTGPVEVTRFVAEQPAAQLGAGSVFVETAPGVEGESLELSAYKAAIARELVSLGYVESNRANATQIAVVRMERSASEALDRRGPVSVGVGGGTGGYGSGVGVGLGINLGGGKNRDRLNTRVGVMLRDVASGTTLWEGRAELAVSPDSPLATSDANAQAIAEALFTDFPGNNGETIEVAPQD